jgi:hypothetical protein
VLAHDRACRQKPPDATLTHDPPSQDLLSTLGILRRPATTDDTLPQGAPPFLPFVKDIYVDYVRVAHPVGGAAFYVIPARDTRAFPPEPAACLHAIHVRLLELLTGKPRGVRVRAHRIFHRLVRANHELARRRPYEGVLVLERRADGGIGGGGGGVNAQFIREQGEFATSGTRSRQAIVNGLIPDGVATVTSFFAAGAGQPAIERTDTVQDNMISFVVDRDAAVAFPSKQVWRAADGSIVRLVRQHG